MKIWGQGDVCNRRFHLIYPLAEGWWCVPCLLGFLLQALGGFVAIENICVKQ